MWSFGCDGGLRVKVRVRVWVRRFLRDGDEDLKFDEHFNTLQIPGTTRGMYRLKVWVRFRIRDRVKVRVRVRVRVRVGHVSPRCPRFPR